MTHDDGEEQYRRRAEQRLRAEAAREFGASPMVPPTMFVSPAAWESTRARGLTPEQERMRDAITLITRLSKNLRNAATASTITLGVALGGIMCVNTRVFLCGAAGMAISFLYARWCVVRIRRTELGPRTRDC